MPTLRIMASWLYQPLVSAYNTPVSCVWVCVRWCCWLQCPPYPTVWPVFAFPPSTAEVPGTDPTGGPSILLQNDIWHGAQYYTQCAGRGRVSLCGLTSLSLNIRASAIALSAGPIYPTISVSSSVSTIAIKASLLSHFLLVSSCINFLGTQCTSVIGRVCTQFPLFLAAIRLEPRQRRSVNRAVCTEW